MTRIGLMSDSHYDRDAIRRALQAMGPVDIVVHLGDGAEDLMELEIPTIRVRGNCDLLASDIPLEESLEVEGIKLIFCHGHRYDVKWDPYKLVYHAREEGARVICFGHTHESMVDMEDGLWIVNPGSCAGGEGRCAVITIDGDRIDPRIIRLVR